MDLLPKVDYSKMCKNVLECNKMRKKLILFYKTTNRRLPISPLRSLDLFAIKAKKKNKANKK